MNQDEIFKTMNGHGHAEELSSYLHETESPFMDTKEVYQVPSSAGSDQQQDQFQPNWFAQDELNSPFLNAYHTPSSKEAPSPVKEAFEELIYSLHDHEFDNAIVELANEAETFYQERLLKEYESGSYNQQVEQLLNHHFDALALEAETLIDNLARRAETVDFQGMQEGEVDQVFQDLVPHSENEAFDYFLKGLWNKAKKVAKGAVNIVKKGVKAVGKILPINLILKKLKAIIRPLLKRVLQTAIGRLPAQVQPIARQLAKKFLNMEVEEGFEMESFEAYEDEVAGFDFELIQREMDASIAVSMVSEQELEPAKILQDELMAFESASFGQPLASIDDDFNKAKERFVEEFSQLRQGDDPTPVIERFLPAALAAVYPVAKVGISIIGRDRVVKFLAGLLAKLVGRFIGEANARLIAAPLVNVGLGLIGLEVQDQSDQKVAAEVIANTVEDFARGIAQYEAAALEEPEMCKHLALKEFENAAARNFPPELLKPQLQEYFINGGSWIPQKYFFKFSRTPTVTITAQMAKNIITFGGRTLYDEIEVPDNGGITVPVHIYKAKRGTWLSRITRYDKSLGFNSAARKYWQQLHYLDKNAAGILFQNPTFGADKPERFTRSRHMIAVGQIFYHLKGTKPKAGLADPYRPRPSAGTGGAKTGAQTGAGTGAGAGTVIPGKASRLNMEVLYDYKNLPPKGWGHLDVNMFYSESAAAAIANEVKASRNLVAVEKAISEFMTQFRSALNRRDIRIRRSQGLQEYFWQKALMSIAGKIGEEITKWLVQKGLNIMEAYLKQKVAQKLDQFVKSQENAGDGVSVRIRIPFTLQPGIPNPFIGNFSPINFDIKQMQMTVSIRPGN